MCTNIDKDKIEHMERLDSMSIEQRLRRLEGIDYFKIKTNKKK